MMDFSVLFPEKPKPLLMWLRRLLLTVFAIVGASPIVTSLVMPWISRSDTMAAFEDRLIIHPQEVILSHPTNKDLFSVRI
jgi:hypothetical protein